MPPKPLRKGVSEIHVTLAPDTPFADVVKHLEAALTLPDVGRLKGCAPCMSGLDRFVLQDERFRELARGPLG